jgi:nucleoside-diphosphate-sugar epimerase
MHILLTGAAGMIGRKLTARLIANKNLNGRPIERLTLLDVSAPERPGNSSAHVTALAADLGEPAIARAAVAGRPGDDYRPRFVFTSSIAVFGAPFPESIPDDFALTPLTSYGAQKAMIELMLADYTRRGFVDGVGIRLPNIVVRPGKPNKAASGFFSSIIREPLNGEEATLPVDEGVRNWHASPRAAVGFLIHGAELDAKELGPRINLTMPGVCCTVGEQIAALRRIAGDKAVARIRRAPDPLVQRIVAGWPGRFDAKRASALGFKTEASFDEIIRAHVDDELGGRIAS